MRSALLLEVSKLLPMSLGWRIPQLPFGNALQDLLGVPLLLSRWLSEIIGALESALIVALIFLAIRLLVKRRWPALGAGYLVLGARHEWRQP